VVQDVQGMALAERMAVLRSAAQAWAHAHPGVDGPIDASLLPLPSWSHGDAATLHVLAQGPVVAVYATGPNAHTVLLPMLRLASGSIWVGTAEHGTLHSPSAGDTGIAVPAGVPEQAPVWLAPRD
jgi:hypothetical protein